MVQYCGCVTGENRWGIAVDTECWSNQWCRLSGAPNFRRSACHL